MIYKMAHFTMYHQGLSVVVALGICAVIFCVGYSFGQKKNKKK